MAGSVRKRVRVVEEVQSEDKNTDSARRDLKSKSLDEIEQIRSRDAPKPSKGLLRNAKADDTRSDDDFQDAIAFDDDADEREADSSDDEGTAEEDSTKAAIDVRQLPDPQKRKSKKRKSSLATHDDPNATSIVYLGRIPHGFYEDQMREYFSQFGEVKRLRLSRNKRTGASKHYAFIEFSYPSVARIVQETMDNYLLAGHILVCKVLAPEQVHPKLWVGANRKFRAVPRARVDSSRRSQPESEEQKQKVIKRTKSKNARKSAELAELGIEY